MAKRTVVRRQTQKEPERLPVVSRYEWKTVYRRVFSWLKQAWSFLPLSLATLTIALWSLLAVQLPITQVYTFGDPNHHQSINITYPHMISYGDPFSIIVTINNPTSQKVLAQNLSISGYPNLIYLSGTNQLAFDNLDAFETKTDAVDMILLSKARRFLNFNLSSPVTSLQSSPIEFTIRKTALPFTGIATDALFLTCLLFAYSYYRNEEPKVGKVVSIIVLSLVLSIILRFASQELKDLIQAITAK